MIHVGVHGAEYKVDPLNDLGKLVLRSYLDRRLDHKKLLLSTRDTKATGDRCSDSPSLGRLRCSLHPILGQARFGRSALSSFEDCQRLATFEVIH